MPVVSQETYDAFIQTLSEEGEMSFTGEVIKLLKDENPVLHDMIIGMTDLASDEEDFTESLSMMVNCVLATYRLLRSQAEADKMNLELGI